MPCEQGVDIPGIFRHVNEFRVYNLHERAKLSYKWIISQKRNASQCTECGKCMEKCPQNIPIIEQLKEAHRMLADPEED